MAASLWCCSKFKKKKKMMTSSTTSEDHNLGDLKMNYGCGADQRLSKPPLSPPWEASLCTYTLGLFFDHSKPTFTYIQVSDATNGFSDDNFILKDMHRISGESGMYRGVLADGRAVAVKSLPYARNGKQEMEFQNQMERIIRIERHEHVVSLLGYSLTGSSGKMVFDFVPDSTLEICLHGTGDRALDWPTRLKIAKGAAKGLAHLHESCHTKIIHRKIRASSIHLDPDFEPKIGDFGLVEEASNVADRITGTFGYYAPELLLRYGRLTEKTDVFSLGVVLLELITGRRPVIIIPAIKDDLSWDDKIITLVDWASPLIAKVLKEGNFDSLVDPRLQGKFNRIEMAQMVKCAAACVRCVAWRRPKMSQVILALEGHEELLYDSKESVINGQN